MTGGSEILLGNVYLMGEFTIRYQYKQKNLS